MLRDIIQKEILDNITSPKFIFTFLLCTVLILLSVYMGAASYVAEKKEHTASVAQNRQDVANKTEYIEVLENGIIYRPPEVLGTVVKGIEMALGRTVRLPKLLVDPKFIESKYGSSPIFAAFGELDLMSIVKFVLSLFAILFTYDAIVGEKENGTLKLALSNHVPRGRLIMGKVIGGYISLLLPLLIPLVLSLIILLLIPDLALSPADWIRIFLILIMFLVYLSVFLSLGLFISARTLRSSTSFLVLLLIWVVFVMIIPKVAVIAAGRIKPVPSVHEITAKKDALAAQGTQESMKSWIEYMRKNAALARKDPKAYQDSMKKFIDETSREQTRKTSEKMGALERDYQLKKKAQQNLAVNLSRISPASALTFGSMSLARTGIDESERFLSSVQSYKQVFFKWYLAKDNSSNLMEKNRSKVKLDDMPQHSFEPENLRNSLVRALPDFGVMLVMIIIFLFGAYVSFLRYDVR